MSLTLIETKTIGAAGAPSIDFTNIPQNFTDLKVLISARSSTVQEHLLISLNGSTANFSGRYINAGNNGVSSGSYPRYIGNQNQSSYNANAFGNATVYIPNYASSTVFKSISSDTAAVTNSAAAYQVMASNVWANTTPITSLSFANEAGTNFTAGSTASLYGVKADTTIVQPKAIGGETITSGGYVYHVFKSSGTFIALQSITADVVMIGGGGGGGYNYGGAGSAGTVTLATGQVLSGAKTVTVGAGGGSGYYNNGNGGSGYAGGSTSFTGLTNAAGGAGGAQGAATGGNGAGGARSGQNGGPGTNAYSTWATATGTGVGGYYAGGGGGGNYSTTGAGGSGGGGLGGAYTLGLYGGDSGVANTGSGGGGGYSGSGAGGSGLVIVRYAV